MRQRKVPFRAASLLLIVCAMLSAAATVRSQTVDDWVAPSDAAKKKNPVAADAQSITRGQALFSNCVICHGAGGHGDGMAAVALNPKPKDLTSALTQSQSDGSLFWKITQGKAPMPPWEQALAEKDRWDLINYLRTIASHGQPAVAGAPAPAGAADSTQSTGSSAAPADLSDLNRRMQNLERQAHIAMPGTEHLVVAGDAAIGFTNQQKTDSTFSAVVSPVILWQPTDRLLFEAGLDIGVATDPTAGSSTSVDLTIGDVSFIVNDYLIVGGGLFVVPFGQYHPHFDPPWINKLPDDPLAFGDGGLAPGSEVGIFARGAAPIGKSSKLVYDLYLSNGPQLVTNDPNAAGSLNFDDFTDLNNGKAVGGRVGILPVPNLETGYSFQYSQTSPDGFPHAYALLQAFDLNLLQEVQSVGAFRLHTEWIWSNVQRETYGGGTTGFGPISFNNYRNGGYAELAYRPIYCPDKIVANFEGVVRYNLLRTPLSSPGGDHEQLWDFGIDYWITPSTVFKVAYELDNKKVGQDQNALMVQLGIGL